MGSSNGTQVNGRKLNLTDSVELKDGDEIVFGLETKAKVILTPRKGLDDITVEQLMMAQSEAAAHEIEAKGKENAKSLLTEIQDSKKTLQQRAHLISN
jgi:pSer/pThr/pTyr-binding forkhead associated (FHA) protein